MIDNLYFARLLSPSTKKALRRRLGIEAATGWVAAINQIRVKVFSEEEVMYKAFWSAKVRDMKFSVERSKTCRLFALWQACLLMGGILLLSATGFAQLSTASLSGAVRDSSGAVVPGAKIVLRNVATGVENTTTSNGAGAYLFLA